MNTLIVLGLALLTLALFARSVFYLPRSTEPERQVVALLEAKHLASGYGNYWGSAIITVYTQGKFSVRQVMPSGNTVIADRFLADERWYHTRETRRFVITSDIYTPQGFADGVQRVFGPYAREYTILPYHRGFGWVIVM